MSKYTDALKALDVKRGELANAHAVLLVARLALFGREADPERKIEAIPPMAHTDPRFDATHASLVDAEIAYDVAYQLEQATERDAAMAEAEARGSVVSPTFTPYLQGLSADGVVALHKRCANARWHSHRTATHDVEKRRYAALRTAHGEAHPLDGAPPHPEHAHPSIVGAS